MENGSSDEETETFARLKITDIKDTDTDTFQTQLQSFITSMDKRNQKCPLRKLNLEFSQQK